MAFSGIKSNRRRRLHGRRGLKWTLPRRCPRCLSSPPSRAAWIEILFAGTLRMSRPSPPSRAAWIEMFDMNELLRGDMSRRLHGRRGLKSEHRLIIQLLIKSPPSRAAWIEIIDDITRDYVIGSPPSRAAWIEMIVIFYDVEL